MLFVANSARPSCNCLHHNVLGTKEGKQFLWDTTWRSEGRLRTRLQLGADVLVLAQDSVHASRWVSRAIPQPQCQPALMLP